MGNDNIEDLETMYIEMFYGAWKKSWSIFSILRD